MVSRSIDLRNPNSLSPLPLLFSFSSFPWLDHVELDLGHVDLDGGDDVVELHLLQELLLLVGEAVVLVGRGALKGGRRDKSVYWNDGGRKARATRDSRVRFKKNSSKIPNVEQRTSNNVFSDMFGVRCSTFGIFFFENRTGLAPGVCTALKRFHC